MDISRQIITYVRKFKLSDLQGSMPDTPYFIVYSFKACLDGMILWFCHVWFFCLDGITMSCVISFNSEENWLGTLSYLIMLYICCIAIAKYMC